MPLKRPASLISDPPAKKLKALSEVASTVRNRKWLQAPKNKAKRADSSNMSYHISKLKKTADFINASKEKQAEMISAKKAEITAKR